MRVGSISPIIEHMVYGKKEYNRGEIETRRRSRDRSQPICQIRFYCVARVLSRRVGASCRVASESGNMTGELRFNPERETTRIATITRIRPEDREMHPLVGINTQQTLSPCAPCLAFHHSGDWLLHDIGMRRSRSSFTPEQTRLKRPAWVHWLT